MAEKCPKCGETSPVKCGRLYLKELEKAIIRANKPKQEETKTNG